MRKGDIPYRKNANPHFSHFLLFSFLRIILFIAILRIKNFVYICSPLLLKQIDINHIKKLNKINNKQTNYKQLIINKLIIKQKGVSILIIICFLFSFFEILK